MLLKQQEKAMLLKKAEKNTALAFMEAVRLMESRMEAMLSDKMKELEDKLPSLAVMKGVEKLKGDPGDAGHTPKKGVDYNDGYTPKKYVDYFTEGDIQQISSLIAKKMMPKKGKDYLTGQDISEIASLASKLVKVENGHTPVPGVDYPTQAQISEMIADLCDKLYKKNDIDGPEIGKRLNKTEGSVDAKVINGLIPFMEDTKRAFKERGGGGGSSGGGMGKIVHETFNVSSATTSVTLASKVAGNVAIWVRYQGQMLAYTTHYTVSDKTVSFSGFTFDDSTVVEISYIRA